jgi:hypothetical protein
MVNPQVGFQPRTTPAERRADLDLARQARSSIAAIYSAPETFSGAIVVDRDATDPNFVSDKSGASNVDGVIHLSIRSNGTEIGRITRATSSTAGFLTSSDADLKENFAPVDDESALLWMRTLEPKFFNYVDKPDVRHVGYSAQEVAELWPNGVSNGVVVPGHGNVNDRTWDENGRETTPPEVWQAWMMDHSKPAPILHAIARTQDRLIAALEARIADLEESGALVAWPVGSVFVSIAPTNPATLLGGGTWVAFGTGRMLVGHDAADTAFDTVEETGGSKTVALVGANLPQHVHGIDHNHAAVTSDFQSANHTHTINHDHAQITTSSTGTHSHGLYYTAFAVGTGPGAWLPKRAQDGGSVVQGTNDAGAHSHTANLPSFAGNSGMASVGHTHTVDLPPFAGTSGPGPGTSTPVDKMPPYIVTYMWKRTA